MAGDTIESAKAELAAGRADAAGAICRRILAITPQYADALHLLGIISTRTGRLDEAIEQIKQAIALRPAAEFQNNLGEALRRAGRNGEAIAAYQQALVLRPAYPQALNNLSVALRDTGRFAESAEAAKRAVEIDPNYAKAHDNLGHALQLMGRNTEAAKAYLQAVTLKPDYYPAVLHLGECLLILQATDDAANLLRRASEMRPDDVVAVFNYGVALEMQGSIPGAITQYERAQKIRPRDSTRLMMATRLPYIYDSHEDLKSWRSRLEENLAAMKREGFRSDIEHIPTSNMFLLAYQGLNDREVLRDYASIISPPPDPPRPERKSDGRIHVGFISTFFRNHTISLVNKGLIAQLDHEQFHATVFTLPGYADEDSAFIRKHADEYVEVPRGLQDSRRLIAGKGLDLLFYTDIGMDNYTFTLAFSRLAPVQCATWGHPSTTGSPAIDYYISSELLESPSAESHYTERLIQLKNLSVYYYRLDKDMMDADYHVRSALGLPEDAHLYGCLQNLFKIHPDYDAILDDILRRDPKGLVLLPRHLSRHLSEPLIKRLTRTMPKTIDRVKFFDHLKYPKYLALSAECDALLAPIHFGAGNTSYEAFALGAPTVTMPSEFLKGRITHGLYRAMGVMDCVAENPHEYAELAVRLATDRDFNRHVRQKILSSNDVLYENPAGVRELEAFFRRIVDIG